MVVMTMVIVRVVAMRVDVVRLMIVRTESSRRRMVPMDRIDDRLGVVLVALQAAGQIDVERVLHGARDFRAGIGGLDDQEITL